MNSIIRLLTVSFMISALVFGIAGYAGSKSRSLPIMQAIEDLQIGGAIMLQEITPFVADGPIPSISGLYFGDSTILLPVCCSAADSNPF